MPDKQLMASGTPQEVSNETCNAVMSDECSEQSSGQPYLNVFGIDVGVFEFTLSENSIIIGRSADADIRLPSRRVSRVHAKLEYSEGKYTVVDANSTSGTTVNGKPCEGYALRHGDSIRIDTYVLQYRTHQTLAGAEAAVARAKLLLHSDYCTLPSSMRLRFRTLGIGASEVFQVGDTLKIGHGGLLIPVSTPPADDACLELDLSVSRHVSKRYLGEIMGVIAEEGVNWMCVKLHTVSREKIEEIVDQAGFEQWIDVTAT